MTRGTDTEVRAYDGEVESLTSADSSGVGIRVLVDGPGGAGSQVGFAWAGSLDPTVIAATLADARDNAALRHAGPRRGPGRARRGRGRGARPVGRRRRVDPMEKKVGTGARARAGDAGRRPEDPAGVLGRLLGQPGGGGARLDDRHLVVPEAHQRLPLGRRHRRRGGGDPDRAPGSASAAGPASCCPTRRRTTPCFGRPACSAPRRCPRRTARSSSTRGWSPRCWRWWHRRSPGRRW